MDHFILHQNKKRRPIPRGKRRKGIRLSRRAPSEALRDASPLLFPRCRRRRCAPSSLMSTGIPCGIATLHCDVLQRGETLCSFCAANDGYKNTYKQTKKGIQKKGRRFNRDLRGRSSRLCPFFIPFFLLSFEDSFPNLRERGNSIFVKISSILHYHLLNKEQGRERGRRKRKRSKFFFSFFWGVVDEGSFSSYFSILFLCSLSPSNAMPPKKQQLSNGAAAASAAVTTSVAVPWTLSAEDAARALGVDPALGLDSGEVERRRDAVGPNELSREAATPLWRLVLAQFDDMLVKVRFLLMRGYGAVTESARARTREREREREREGRRGNQKKHQNNRSEEERSPAARFGFLFSTSPTIIIVSLSSSLSATQRSRSSSPPRPSPSSSPSSTARPPTRGSRPLSSRGSSCSSWP